MNLNRAFALRLSNLLLEKKMTKYKLEKETGLTHSALRYIFNEVNVDVKFSTIVKVCNALNITLSDFFDDELFNYGFAYNILNGLVPYRDFNMIIPPLFNYLLAGILKLFGTKLIVYHFVIASIILLIFL